MLSIYTYERQQKNLLPKPERGSSRYKIQIEWKDIAFKWFSKNHSLLLLHAT